MLTMFEITLGNWPPVARLLQDAAHTAKSCLHALTKTSQPPGALPQRFYMCSFAGESKPVVCNLQHWPQDHLRLLGTQSSRAHRAATSQGFACLAVINGVASLAHACEGAAGRRGLHAGNLQGGTTRRPDHAEESRNTFMPVSFVSLPLHTGLTTDM